MHIRYLIIHVSILLLLTSCGNSTNKQSIDEGLIEGNTYTSKELGWTISIPENWQIVSRAQNEEHESLGKEIIEDVLEEEVSAVQLKHLIGFQKNDYNIFKSTSEPIAAEYREDWVAYNEELKGLLYQAYASQGIQADSSATEIVRIDGLDFYSYEFILYGPKGEVILKQLVYSTLINGLDFGVHLTYNNETDKEEMLNAWLNSTFKK